MAACFEMKQCVCLQAIFWEGPQHRMTAGSNKDKIIVLGHDEMFTAVVPTGMQLYRNGTSTMHLEHCTEALFMQWL